MRTGLMVTHPLSGESIEVWVGNYVLMSYGDGAVMGVPAHDERDFAFAKKYGIAITQVIHIDGLHYDYERWQDWYADKQSRRDDQLRPVQRPGRTGRRSTPSPRRLHDKGLGDKQTTWRLRDWGISRQRYWGTPIPIIHCDEHGAVPVPESDLPVLLPEDLIPDGSGNPLNQCEAFVNVACPVCGKPARRETDTMDTFVDSSWYFMRYCNAQPAGGDVAPSDDRRARRLLDADGPVHRRHRARDPAPAVCALLDQGDARPEAGRRRRAVRAPADAGHGAQRGVLAHPSPAAARTTTGRATSQIERDEHSQVRSAVLRADGQPVHYEGWTTMSKSKNNGVDPQALIDRFGADTARLFVMFASPPEQTLEWNDAGVEGAHRFLRRVWNFAQRQRPAAAGRRRPATASPTAPPGRCASRSTRVLRQISYDYERLQYNTVVSGAMKLLNALEGHKGEGDAGDAAVLREGFGILLRCLYPACPHITWTLWNELGYAGRARRPARRTVAAGRRGCAGAGRDRTDAAGQRQAARLDHGRRPVPTRRRSRPRRSRTPTSSASPRASGRRRSSSCRAGWSTWSSDAAHATYPAGGRAGAAARRLRLPAAARARVRLPPRAAERFRARVRRWPRNCARSIDASPTTRVVDTPGAGRGRAARADRRARAQRRREHRRRPGARAAAAAALRLPRSRAPTARELIPPREIVLSRDMSYSETIALAKELEEAALYRAMQSDIVAQVLRRLAVGAAALSPPRSDAAARRPARRAPEAGCGARRPATGLHALGRRGAAAAGGRRLRSAPLPSARAMPSARCTPWPARISTGAACSARRRR